MAIFMGGFAMFTAGLMEWKKGNTYGLAAYSSYGMYWFSFAALLLLPVLGLVKDTGGAGAMAAYLALWGLFTVIMFIGSLKMSRALQFVLGTLALVFFFEAAGAATGNGMFTIVAGYIEVISGLAAIYTALGPVLNELYGKTVAPLG
jgi:succinate-acetate transporter protein